VALAIQLLLKRSAGIEGTPRTSRDLLAALLFFGRSGRRANRHIPRLVAARRVPRNFVAPKRFARLAAKT
jgi:hypothetical protein